MKILNFRVFKGRNIYSHHKCIRINIDIQGYSEILRKDIYNFNRKIVSMFPGIDQHNTNVIAVNIAQDKLLTKQILRCHWIPVARGMKVENKMDSILCAKEIGYPVVLKYQFGNEEKGIISNIINEKQLSDAYELLSKNYKDIILEKYISGRGYRVCCVYGDIIAVSERIPPSIIGDNINSSENTIGFTALIGEKNLKICKRAASAIGLNICEIDLRCADINKDGVIIDINAGNRL